MVVAFYRVYKIYMIEKPALHSCKSFDHPAAGGGTAYTGINAIYILTAGGGHKRCGPAAYLITHYREEHNA